jgi:hypothetical protein
MVNVKAGLFINLITLEILTKDFWEKILKSLSFLDKTTNKCLIKLLLTQISRNFLAIYQLKNEAKTKLYLNYWMLRKINGILGLGPKKI